MTMKWYPTASEVKMLRRELKMEGRSLPAAGRCVRVRANAGMMADLYLCREWHGKSGRAVYHYSNRGGVVTGRPRKF